MKLARTNKSGMDFEFQSRFYDISSDYKEVKEGDPRLLCQASWATTDYINENLPAGLVWDNESGVLIDRDDSKYTDCEKVTFHGEEYAVCPEAYEKLYALLTDAVENGLKQIFGHARKYRNKA